jgi:nicotinamidase-related amidase
MSKVIRQLIEGRAVLLVIDREIGPAKNGSALIDAARSQDIPIVYVSKTAAGSAVLATGEHSVRRRRNSAFFGTDLAVLLGDLGAKTLILMGGETSVSVHYTFVDAHQHDYFCRVAEDTMTGTTAYAHEAALRAMEYMQTGARRHSSDVIAALSEQRAAR